MSGTDSFESVVKERREEAVAEFHEDRTPLRRFQNALHAAPCRPWAPCSPPSACCW